MAGAKFEYDSNGGTFFYFLLSFEALVVIPATYYFWPRSLSRQEHKRDKSQCDCDNCSIKASRLRSKEPWRKAKQRFIKFLLLIGWTALLLTLYKVAHLQHDFIAYDPFEILQIDPEASMTEIKKAYRRLSLVHHPDKESGDERKFMQIAKAYAALTDEEAKKNWQLYGNPDGPGAMRFGIALPSFIVQEQNSFLVLGLYALVFMVALPVAVGIWWYRSVQFGTDEVRLDTSQLYYCFIHRTPYMIMKRTIMILAASNEFDRRNNSEIIERPSDNVEVVQLIKECHNLNEKNKERPLCYSYSMKARALLHAHLSRIELPPNTLEEDRLYIIKKCPYLLNEFIRCTSQLTLLAIAGKIPRMPHLDTMENAMKLCPMIVQALWDNKSPLLQLPHITEDCLRHFTTRKRNIRSMRQLASMKGDDRRAMLRSLNDDQYDDLMNVIAKMPLLDIDVKSEVLDDEDSGTITAGAMVTVTAFLSRRNMEILFDTTTPSSLPDATTAATDYSLDDDVALLPNGDASPKAKKNKVWGKQQKKKKSKGGNKSKKKSLAVLKAAVHNKKSELPNGVLPNAKVEVKPDNSGDESSGGDVSGGETEDEEERAATNKGACDVEEDAEWEKFQQKVAKKDKKVFESKAKKSHTVHCPFFPDEKQENWWIYLTDKKRHALVTDPYLVTSLVDNEEVELKFTAPSKPGIHTYSMIVRSDSYIDFDVVKTLKLDIHEAKEVDLSKLQWDVSEDEEEKDEGEESAVEDSDLATSSDGDDDLDDH